MKRFLLVAALLGTAAADEPADFGPQAKELFRVVACGADDPVPAKFDASTVAAHCRQMHTRMDEYTHKWVDVAAPFLAKVVPSGLPPTVVYPFGGGDLITALATYPDATEYTTLSLETSGDVRKIDGIAKDKLKDALAQNLKNVARLFKVAHSKTTNLNLVSTGDLPGEIVFSLVALAVHGYEPVGLRYFHLGPDGAVVYLSAADIAAAEAAAAKLQGRKHDDAEQAIFDDFELTFRKQGDANAPLKTFRHLMANLDNAHLAADPSILKHLEAKGKVAAMTKAASYLLWWDDFKSMREYLLANMAWMISDSTGIPSRFATAAGFEEVTYGQFTGPFLAAGKEETKEMVDLWAKNPSVELPFRFGYPDADHHAHMMVTRKK